MAPTFRPGKKAWLKLVHGGSTMIISSGADTAELARACEAYEVTTLGHDDKANISGLRSGTVKIGGPFASTYEAFLAACLGSSANPTWQYGPESTATGRVKMTGAFVITNYTVTTPANGRSAVAIDATVSGPIASTHF